METIVQQRQSAATRRYELTRRGDDITWPDRDAAVAFMSSASQVWFKDASLHTIYDPTQDRVIGWCVELRPPDPATTAGSIAGAFTHQQLNDLGQLAEEAGCRMLVECGGDAAHTPLARFY